MSTRVQAVVIVTFYLAALAILCGCVAPGAPTHSQMAFDAGAALANQLVGGVQQIATGITSLKSQNEGSPTGTIAAIAGGVAVLHEAWIRYTRGTPAPKAEQAARLAKKAELAAKT